MRVHVSAVGRLRAGPERALVDDYRARFDKTGRALGLGPLHLHEVEDRKGGGKPAEAMLLDRTIPKGAILVAIDERGEVMTTPEFSHKLAVWRDTGNDDLACVIGGADGLDPALRVRADLTLSFGRMVWPHMLARVMLVEQLYRSASILAGSPYHRA